MLSEEALRQQPCSGSSSGDGWDGCDVYVRMFCIEFCVVAHGQAEAMETAQANQPAEAKKTMTMIAMMKL